MLLGSSVLADTTEVELKEARTLVTATQKVSISSEISARVEKINFLMGDAFKKGDVLISFDCKLYNAQLEVRFRDVYPTALTDLTYSQQAADVDYLTATVSFNYLIYDFANSGSSTTTVTTS